MALWDGTPEWAHSLVQGRVRSLRVPLPVAQYEFVGFPEAVSSVYTRVLAGLSSTCPRRPRSLDSSGCGGEMAMVNLCCHPLYGTACAVGVT